jgi:hypothetical protein
VWKMYGLIVKKQKNSFSIPTLSYKFAFIGQRRDGCLENKQSETRFKTISPDLDWINLDAAVEQLLEKVEA